MIPPSPPGTSKSRFLSLLQLRSPLSSVAGCLQSFSSIPGYSLPSLSSYGRSCLCLPFIRQISTRFRDLRQQRRQAKTLHSGHVHDDVSLSVLSDGWISMDVDRSRLDRCRSQISVQSYDTTSVEIDIAVNGGTNVQTSVSHRSDLQWLDLAEPTTAASEIEPLSLGSPRMAKRLCVYGGRSDDELGLRKRCQFICTLIKDCWALGMRMTLVIEVGHVK
ncbi:hypothetical protein TIFTF001_025895 [Ficus carica]|uniref:Uncharacterized protein n=1 Tax=Ficus carica TaxID=3494 RepID=A0AA88DFW7_FICCA|nr:hypothetical protein TIFTF001_025895 [Ficus carica]